MDDNFQELEAKEIKEAESRVEIGNNNIANVSIKIANCGAI